MRCFEPDWFDPSKECWQHFGIKSFDKCPFKYTGCPGSPYKKSDKQNKPSLLEIIFSIFNGELWRQEGMWETPQGRPRPKEERKVWDRET